MVALVVISFHTGDASCPTWEECVVVRLKDKEIPTRSQLATIQKDIETTSSTAEYHERVEAAFNKEGLDWAWFKPCTMVDMCLVLYID